MNSSPLVLENEEYEPYSYWSMTSWRTIFSILNAICGLIWLEVAFRNTKRHRAIHLNKAAEEMDASFPAWRRSDA